MTGGQRSRTVPVPSTTSKWRAGYSWEKFAEISGFSQEYISGFERGRRNPTVISLYELAAALGANHLDLVRPIKGRRRWQGISPRGWAWSFGVLAGDRHGLLLTLFVQDQLYEQSVKAVWALNSMSGVKYQPRRKTMSDEERGATNHECAVFLRVETRKRRIAAPPDRDGVSIVTGSLKHRFKSSV